MIKQNHKIKVMIPIAILCYGGTEAQTLHLVRVLKRSGYEIEVVCFYENYADIVKEYENNGATVTLLNLDKKNNKLKLFHSLYQYYLERRPDVVHVQYVQQGFIALVAALLAHVPIRFATVHQLGSNYGIFQRMLLRTASRMTTMFLCVSQAAERSWFGEGDFWNLAHPKIRKHYTIYDSVDVERIKNLVSNSDRNKLQSRYGLKNSPIIGIVGRTSHDKGQIILLDACSIVTKSFPDVQILIVGEDYQRDEIMLRASKYGLQRNVVMTGRVPSNDLYQLYSIMDLVAIPSRSEGFGLTAVEAMVAGKPVVASRVGGLTEIVQDGITGFLVEPQNHRELADAILKCLKDNDYSAQLGVAGGKRAEEMFSLDIYARVINSLYQWALSNNLE
jgi:glycosyltransferase involved in cell wall biosynthesis